MSPQASPLTDRYTRHAVGPFKRTLTPAELADPDLGYFVAAWLGLAFGIGTWLELTNRKEAP